MNGSMISALRPIAAVGAQTPEGQREPAGPTGQSHRYNRVLFQEAAMRERAVPSSESTHGLRLVARALTFDDVLLIPAYSEVLPRETSLRTRLTRNITLNIPLVAAAMDTVTEARLAIAMAQEGGIGIVHKNLSPEAQATEVARVKRFESGIVSDPITVPASMSVREVVALTQQYRISGLPVIEDGRVVGIVTNRDLRFEQRLDIPVRDIMTPRARLVTVPEGTGLPGPDAHAPPPPRARACGQ